MGKKFFGVIAFAAIRRKRQAGISSRTNRKLNFLTWRWKTSRLLQEVRVELIIAMTLQQ